MRNLLLFLAIATTLMSCTETRYVTSLESFQNAVQSLNSELANDGFGVTEFRQTSDNNLEGVVNYHFRNGVSMSKPVVNERFHDTYELQNQDNERLSYTVGYEVDKLWNRYYYAKDINVESYSASNPTVFERYVEKLETLNNPRQESYQRVNPTVWIATSLSAFAITTLLLTHYLK